MKTVRDFQEAAQCFQSGRHAEAEAICRELLRRNPNDASALNLIGAVLAERREFEAAIDFYQRAIRLRPDVAELYRNRGNAHLELKQFDLAIESYRRAIQLNPQGADAQNSLGNALMGKGQIESAIAAYRRAIEIRPDDAYSHFNLGIALGGRGKRAEAISAYRKAIQFNEQFADAYNNLGTALWEDGQLQEAIPTLRRAIEIQPGFHQAYTNLGNALLDDGQFEAAIAAYRNAIRIQPNHAEGYYNLGNVFKSTLELAPAIEAYETAIRLQPDLALAHWNLSWSLLLRGDFARGWREYEWRGEAKGSGRLRKFAQPQWKGEDLTAKTIVLHAEQGLGDTIQFIRYAPMVAERGGRVIFLGQKKLARLLRCVAGLDGVLTSGSPLPEFDYQCPLLSLPGVFGTDLDSIPRAIPYLTAEPELVEQWRAKIADGSQLQVGLVWAGSPTNKGDHKRSIALRKFAPLGEVAGIRFHSLQKGSAASQTPPEGMNFVDHEAEIKDFADTAALITNLDLVISVDTAAAHLAGALGKPVWMLVRFDPDWRWLLDRNDSPWYPTLRLFRQHQSGDWEEPIREIAQALAALRAKQSR
ncbi:MAG: tetratricopeptide repeat protein [Tepidisphaeraceae bacterium]